MCDSRGACRENSVSVIILQHDDAERNSTVCIEGRGSVDGSQFSCTSAHVVHVAVLFVSLRYVNETESDEDQLLRKSSETRTTGENIFEILDQFFYKQPN